MLCTAQLAEASDPGGGSGLELYSETTEYTHLLFLPVLIHMCTDAHLGKAGRWFCTVVF